MTAKVLGICASKGGVSKSVLTTALGAAAANRGERVVLLDGDPQQSLSMWWELRGKPANPDVYETTDVVKDVAELRAEDWDWIIIDAPPGNWNRIGPIVRASDFVLIPLKVSAFDLDAVAPVVEDCRKYKKDFAFVLTQTDPEGKHHADKLAKTLRKDGEVLTSRLGYLRIYATALTTGKTGPEGADKQQAAEAREQIDAIWAAIHKQMGIKPAKVR